MLIISLLFAVLGILLLVSGPLVARRLHGGRDSIGLARIIQVAGVVLLLLALLARPHNKENTAFPAPPENSQSR